MLWGLSCSIILLILIFILIKKSAFFHLEGIGMKWVYSAFMIKLLGGIALYILYTFHYQDRTNSDIFKYYDDAISIYQYHQWNLNLVGELFFSVSDRSAELEEALTNTQHWDRGDQFLPNDNRMMIKLNLLLLFISREFYLFHLLFFSSLSFIGSIGLYHFFKRYSKIPSPILLGSLILAPSVLLWTSGMLKESLFLFAFGGLLYASMRFKESRGPTYVPLMLIYLVLLIGIKSYLLICFIPSFMIYMMYNKIGLYRSVGLSLLITLLLLFSQKELFESEIIRVHHNFTQLAIESNANSSFELEKVTSLNEFIYHSPQALYNIWLRPMMPKGNGILDLMSAGESLIYLLILILVMPFRNKELDEDQKMLIILSLIFVLGSSLLIGNTIPILGAIVRYRSPLIIFYLISLFTFVDLKQLKRKLPIK